MQVFLTEQLALQRYVLSLAPNLLDAQEILQETALELWKRFDEYHPARPFRAWAFRFAKLQTLAYLKRRRRSNALGGDVVEQLADRRAAMEGKLDGRRIALAECLERLPPKDRRLLEQRYVSATPMEQAAAELNRTVHAVYKALERIRAALAECVDRRTAGEARP